MEVTAIGKNIGISRIKARIPADVVRNMNALEAVAVLTFMRKGTALPVKKVIESAIANAKNNYNLDPANLYITEIRIDKGPQAKFNTRRIMPAAKGRAKFFDRKYSHIKVVLTDRVPTQKVVETKEEVKVEKVASAEVKETKSKAKKTTAKGSKKA